MSGSPQSGLIEIMDACAEEPPKGTRDQVLQLACAVTARVWGRLSARPLRHVHRHWV